MQVRPPGSVLEMMTADHGPAGSAPGASRNDEQASSPAPAAPRIASRPGDRESHLAPVREPTLRKTQSGPAGDSHNMSDRGIKIAV